jgi:hypothetical protein
VRVSIPFWLLRLAPSRHDDLLERHRGLISIPIRVHITLDDLERRGPASSSIRPTAAARKCSSGRNSPSARSGPFPPIPPCPPREDGRAAASCFRLKSA